MSSPTINTLPKFPLVNQLNEPTTDGHPDENAPRNCVAASLSAALTYLLHKPFYGDQVKDAVYGQGYTGMQAPEHYVAYCKEQGVRLAPFDSPGGLLVTFIHTQIPSGHPVLATIPSQWGIPVAQQKPGYTTHVVCMAGFAAGWLRAMNPWGGFWQDGNDAYWAARLCYNQVWALSLVPVTPPPPPPDSALIAQLEAKIANAQKALA